MFIFRFRNWCSATNNNWSIPKTGARSSAVLLVVLLVLAGVALFWSKVIYANELVKEGYELLNANQPVELCISPEKTDLQQETKSCDRLVLALIVDGELTKPKSVEVTMPNGRKTIIGLQHLLQNGDTNYGAMPFLLPRYEGENRCVVIFLNEESSSIFARLECQ